MSLLTLSSTLSSKCCSLNKNNSVHHYSMLNEEENENFCFPNEIKKNLQNTQNLLNDEESIALGNGCSQY